MQSLSHSLVHYDGERRRLWIAGQRCHHGATGALLASAAATGLMARRLGAGPIAAFIAAGTLMMADDWHDRSIWFQRGWQDQP